MTRTSSEIHCSMTTMLRKLSSIFTRTSNSSRPLSTELAGRLKGFDAPTVWSEFTPLSQQHKSVNLGQGFPDWESPPFVKEAMVAAIHENHNQYCRSGGELSLVNELSAHYSKLIGRTINPLTEVTVSVGATEGIFALMQALVNEGDEVIVIEPNFDIYPAQVQMAGGVCKVDLPSYLPTFLPPTFLPTFLPPTYLPSFLPSYLPSFNISNLTQTHARTDVCLSIVTNAYTRVSRCSTTRHRVSGAWIWQSWSS